MFSNYTKYYYIYWIKMMLSLSGERDLFGVFYSNQ